MLRTLALIALALGTAEAQIFGGGGRNNKMSKEEMDHMQGTPQGASAVDRAMQEWDTLAQNPDMMQEMMESFKDPEVQAKAKEMINDPEYMRAAKKKLAEMQKRAQQAGLLDRDNNPVPGAATAAAQANPSAANMMADAQRAWGFGRRWRAAGWCAGEHGGADGAAAARERADEGGDGRLIQWTNFYVCKALRAMLYVMASARAAEQRAGRQRGGASERARW